MPTRGAHQMVVGRKLGEHGQREVTAESLARMVEQTRVRAAKAGSDEIFGCTKSDAGVDAVGKLMHQMNAEVVAFAFLINLNLIDYQEKLKPYSNNFITLVNY